MSGHRHSLKWWVIAIALLLIGGAVANVAVAWVCAAWIDPNRSRGPNGLSHLDDGHHWAVECQNSIGKSRFVSKVWFGFASRYMNDGPAEQLVPDWGRIARPVLPAESYPYSMSMVDEATGLPMRSMWCGWGETDLSPQTFTSGQESLPLATPGVELAPVTLGGSYGGKAIPFLLIWPGFLVNTLFYAVILWMLFAVPFALRRKRRKRRGLCPACAYPIGTSEICTECGRAVTAQSFGKDNRGST